MCIRFGLHAIYIMYTTLLLDYSTVLFCISVKVRSQGFAATVHSGYPELAPP